MYGTRHTSPLAHLRRGVLAALACFALTANAQVNSPGLIVNDTVVYTPGMQRIEVGGQGRPIVTQGQPNLTTNNGPLTVNRSLVLRNPSNVPVEVVARTPMTGAQVARILRKGASALPVIGTGIALFDVAQELGFSLTKTAGGQPVIQQQSVATDLWRLRNMAFTADVEVRASSAQAACVSIGAQWITNPFQGVQQCNRGNPNSGWDVPTRVANTTQPGALQPSSLDALQAAAAARTSWPPSSRLPQAVSDVLAREPERLDPAPNTVTGPAQSQGQTTVTDNPDGTRTTTTTVHNHTYAGNTVNTTTVTTVSVFNPTTNTTTNTTTTTTPTPSPQEQPTQCELYPNSLGCKELDQAPAEQVPRETRNVTYAPESVNWGASASCPAPISIGTFAGGARQLDFAPFCDVAERARPFVLAGAAMLAMMILVAGIRV